MQQLISDPDRFLVENNINTLVFDSTKATFLKILTKYFKFVDRQALYYFSAAEFLGFVDYKNDILNVTAFGKEIDSAKLSSTIYYVFFTLLKEPIFNKVISEKYLNNHDISFDAIYINIQNTYKLSEETSKRRAQTVQKWVQILDNFLS